MRVIFVIRRFYLFLLNSLKSVIYGIYVFTLRDVAGVDFGLYKVITNFYLTSGQETRDQFHFLILYRDRDRPKNGRNTLLPGTDVIKSEMKNWIV